MCVCVFVCAWGLTRPQNKISTIRWTNKCETFNKNIQITSYAVFKIVFNFLFHATFDGIYSLVLIVLTNAKIGGIKYDLPVECHIWFRCRENCIHVHAAAVEAESAAVLAAMRLCSVAQSESHWFPIQYKWWCKQNTNELRNFQATQKFQKQFKLNIIWLCSAEFDRCIHTMIDGEGWWNMLRRSLSSNIITKFSLLCLGLGCRHSRWSSMYSTCNIHVFLRFAFLLSAFISRALVSTLSLEQRAQNINYSNI